MKALQTVSATLESAAFAVANAASETTLAAASASLAQARVAVIIADQELENAQSDEAAEASIDAAELALARASRVIVLATAFISESQAGLHASGESSAPGTALNNHQLKPVSHALINGEDSGLDSGLDKALNASITHFDKLISASRQQVLDATPRPASAPPQQRPMLAGIPTQDTTPNPRNSPGPIAADIPRPQADDIIAQQLWEAATMETDIERQNKLWEAYRRYRSGL